MIKHMTHSSRVLPAVVISVATRSFQKITIFTFQHTDKKKAKGGEHDTQTPARDYATV